MAPEFSNQELTEHDMIVKMFDFQEEVTKPMFEDLKKGRIGVCQRHSESIKWLWRAMVAISTALGTLAGWVWASGGKH